MGELDFSLATPIAQPSFSEFKADVFIVNLESKTIEFKYHLTSADGSVDKSDVIVINNATEFDMYIGLCINVPAVLNIIQQKLLEQS